MTTSRCAAGARRQRGLTIVELMLAITVSLLLMLGVGQLFLSNKRTYQVNEGLSRLQENARFVLNVIASDVRMAGFMGCAGGLTPNIIADNDADGNADTVANFTTANGIQGYTNANLPITIADSNTLSASDVVAGNDIFAVKRAANSGVSLVGNMIADNANIQISPSAAGLFAAHDYLFISDCSSADVFSASNVSNGSTITIAHANNVNTDNRVSKAYTTEASVMKLESSIYFIGLDISNRPVLKRRRLDGSTIVEEELGEGVEAMQLLYGEDTDADGSTDIYRNAASVADWSAVKTVKIALLLRTVQEITGALDTRSYSLLHGDYNPVDDRRIRRLYTNTIQIRNR